jgi:hypothetical protein
VFLSPPSRSNHDRSCGTLSSGQIPSYSGQHPHLCLTGLELRTFLMVVVHACGLGAAEGTMQAVFFGARKKLFWRWRSKGRSSTTVVWGCIHRSSVRDTQKNVISHSVFSRVESLTAEMASDTVIYTCGSKFYPGGLNINCPWVMFGISNACFRPPNSLLRNPGLSKEYEMLLTEFANITQQSCRVARVKYRLQVSRSRIKNDVLIAQTWNMMGGTLTTFRYSTI